MRKLSKKVKNKKFWEFKNAVDTVGELFLYGDISGYESWWDDVITPKQFKEDLDNLGDITTLNIYINSGGGDVFAGQAIHSMLRRHKATKNVYIDGLAASIASVIAVAGDKVIMPKNAMMMIHKCWTWTMGNANDMRKMAEDMDKIDESIVAAYVEKTGLEKDKIVELMDAETWMTAEDAVSYGFADEIEDTKQVAASIGKGRMVMNGQTFDLSRYRNPPKLDGKSLVLNEGRTLSAANEQRISQARDLLGEVLDQLDGEGESNAAVPGRRPPKNATEPMMPPEPPDEPEEGIGGDCACENCSHSDNCQAAGAKCCICSNCDMADKCSKPGAEGCNCKDCTMAQTNCCQPGSESCMCDSCTNTDCKKGHMEGEQSNPEDSQSKALVDLYAKLNLNNRRKANV